MRYLCLYESAPQSAAVMEWELVRRTSINLSRKKVSGEGEEEGEAEVLGEEEEEGNTEKMEAEERDVTTREDGEWDDDAY